jgi:hypothetical protein
MPMPWSRHFDVPISMPCGPPLTTLGEAALYVVALPKAEQQKDHWQVAAAALIVAGEHNGSLTIAEYAMRQALIRYQPELEL